MMRRMIQILLCFVVIFIRRSTLRDKRLYTGYVYPVGEQGHDRQKDLKCAFWFSGIVHMRLAKILLKTRGPTNKTFKPIFEYNRNTKAQLAALYNLKTERIGALWLVHLYINKVNQYHRFMRARSDYRYDETLEKILTTAEFVISKLESDTTEYCRKGNRFDWNDKAFTDSLLSDVAYVQQLIDENAFDMTDMLTANEANNLLELSNLNDFHISNILVDNFGVREDFLQSLLVDFESGVIWSDTKRRLSDAWCNTRDLDWIANHLGTFKFYFSAVSGVLEIIMLRMSLEYLLNQRRAKTNEVKLSHAEKWRNELQRFADVLKLGEKKDTHIIRYLINAFDSDTIAGGEHLLIDHIQTELTRLSELLGCDAIQTLYAFPSGEPSAGNTVQEEILRLRRNANTFIELLKSDIIKRDFAIVWALMAYIDELNQYQLF